MPTTATEPTPVHSLQFRGRHCYIKRDDLISDFYPGNKYRKLYALIQSSRTDINTLVSYGGAQSNAMVAIAHLAQQKGWRFTYYTKPLPDYLKKSLSGNLKEALACGMQHHELSHETYNETVAMLADSLQNGELLIPQGGADAIAKEGVSVLAEEIKAWAASMQIEELLVATPSGTGTTSLYLSQLLPETFEVVTTPSVGDAAYLRVQWHHLEPHAKRYPTILETAKRYRFAKPYEEFKTIYSELLDAGVEFDLIYAPKIWLALDEQVYRKALPLLYVHSGGISGNVTQLQRYNHAFG